MGNDNILIDQGATTKLGYWSGTDGTNTVYVAKQKIDEAFQPTYGIAIPSSTALATANSHILEIVAGASQKVTLQRLQLWQIANSTSIQLIQFRLYRLTSAGTGGLVVPVAPFDLGDAAAGATAMTLPTGKGTETALLDDRRGLVHTTVATVGVGGLTLVDYDFRGLRHKGIVIPAGTSNGIALKNVTSDAAGTVEGTAWVSELAYSL